MGLRKFRKKKAKDEKYYNLSVILSDTEKYLKESTTQNRRSIVWDKKCSNGK